MGNGLSIYHVNLAKLRAAAGSGDERLAKSVNRKLADEIDSNANFFAHQIGKGAPRLDRAVTEIISGPLGRKKREHAFQYGYALELLCRYFGSGGMSEAFERLRDDWPRRYDTALKRVGVGDAIRITKLLRWSPPIAVPHRPNWFPVIATIEANAASHAIAKLDKRALAELEASTDDDDQALAVGVGEVIGWSRTAKKRKTGIVSFFY